jgi:hypothetical protein
MIFSLPNGREVEKNAEYCVAVRANGRWSHQFFKTLRGARNEMRRLCGYQKITLAYYGIEDFKMIRGAQ